MDYKTIRYEVSDGLAVVTLDRPHRNNAWTNRMETEYRHALGEAERDRRVGAIVLTGEGRNFCVGADSGALSDIAGRGEHDSTQREPLVDPGDPTHPAHGTRHAFLLSMSTPVVCAINGAAAGVGFVIACFADIRIAADDAKLTGAMTKLGLPAEFAVHWILPRMIGHSRAMEMLLSSRVVGAAEAERIGLVHAVHPAGELLERACEYARELIDTAGPGALRIVKAQLTRDLARPLDESEAEAARLMDEMAAGEEFRRGMAAFTERRPTRFRELYR